LLWVKVFGFSYTVLRFSTLPLAALAISLCYLLGRRVGLQPRFAVFAALSVGLSPLYLPVASSFMTDAPGLFCIFLSLYLLIRAIESPKTSVAIGWLVAGLVVGLVGGTGRQIVWVVPLVVGPYAAWLRRDNLIFVFSAMLGWALVFGGALLTLAWFAHQPYSIPEISLSTDLKLAVHNRTHYMLRVLGIGFTTLWMILPSLWGICRRWVAGFSGSERTMGVTENPSDPMVASEQLPTAAIPLTPPSAPIRLDYAVGERRSDVHFAARVVVAFVLLLLVLLLVLRRPHYSLAPWMGNTLSRQGVMGGSELEGRPDAMPIVVRAVSAIVVYLAACCLAADLLIWLSRPLTAVRSTIRFFLYPERGKTLLPAMTLFAAAYLVLLLPRSASNMVFDRYILVLMPCVLFPLLLSYQRQGDRKVPAASWVLFGIYTLYGLAITQDISALGRARAVATDRLIEAGKPRVQIDAGFEYDYETQLETVGHINDPRIRVPANAFKKNLGPTYCVQAAYRLEFGPTVISTQTPFGSVDYTSFVYPFHRTIYIDKYNDPWWLDPSRAATHPADKWHQLVPSDNDDPSDK